MAACVMFSFCRMLFLFIIVNVYLLNNSVSCNPSDLKKPSAEFTRHTLVKPKIYHGREKRQITTSKEKGRNHAHDIIIHYNIHGKDCILDLRLNRNLLPKGYFRKYQKNGKHVVDTPNAEEVELCQYSGKIRGLPNSWAALSTCGHGLSGMIFDGDQIHHVEKATEDHTSGLSDHHYFYKHSDLLESNKSCGYHDYPEAYSPENNHQTNKLLSRFKRSSTPLIRGPYNANKNSRYVELVLVVDNREYKEHGENLGKVYQHCKDIANIINGLYSMLNIFIALVGVVVWTERDEIELSSNGDTTLTNFLHYRREKLIYKHPNDNAQLLTKFVFDKGVVGKALKGPICTFEYSGGVSMDHSAVVSLVATTVAHEMGHNFGMEHDTISCYCPEERCIMAPSSSSLWPTHWSSCSLDSLALAFEKGMDYCLRNKPETLFDSPVCGNGFVEPGEQCDCGLPQTCNNTCCNASSCMLYSNATCATGECCDLNTCHPKQAGSTCRAADYECDLPEYCTGQSEYCPADVYKMDTESCDNGKAFCYQGSCRTRSDQCKLLWGFTGKSSDEQCYNMNTRGSRHGNCGYHRINQTYIKCQEEDVLCGMLHCRHLNERLEFGMESVAILSQSFINHKGSIIPCRTAIVDLGLNQVDPGLAPDGAKCGEDSMCVNQKCMSVEGLRATKNMCSQDCNGNGICNSLGHCHCKDGFGPPYCDGPGPGGSEDSGPASNPNARRWFIVAMYILFLGIIPIISILSFLIYYMRHNVNFKWQKPNSTSKPPSKPRSSPFPPEPSSRTEDNSSLLAEGQNGPNRLQPEFFGQFKGFKLSPLLKNDNEIKPQRSAPPVPIVPNIPTLKSPIRSPNSNGTRPPGPEVHSTPKHMINQIEVAVPALPPLNPGSNPRPLISSPVLEASTCTAKELISPLRHAPKTPVRSAPGAPTSENVRPLSHPNTMAPLAIPEEKPGKNTSTLNRIASFLKKEDKKTPAHPPIKPQLIKPPKTLDKDQLKTIQISNPIPQSEIPIPENALSITDDKCKAVVMRAQSMRGTNVTQRPPLASFGSMRQCPKRPTSIPVGNRPKSPPPPRPPLPDDPRAGARNVTVQGTDSKVDDAYDDCENGPPDGFGITPESGDNIYAVIEENPKIENDKSNSGSNESMGLLGEIVSEIQNRNFDSIYGTSTLARKKKEQEQQSNNETYVNTSAIYKSPESVYSNMNNSKSSASSTASGYIHPSALNKPANTEKTEPIATKITAPPKLAMSTFKNKEITPVRRKSQDNITKINRQITPPNLKTRNNEPLNTRQVTPPNLRTRKQSPSRVNSGMRTPPRPENSNSPDIVMSCSSSITSNPTKSPDVLINSGKPSVKVPPKPVGLSQKTGINKLPVDRKPLVKNGIKSEVKTLPIGSRIAAKNTSNVANLQQKFEVGSPRPSVAVKSAPNKKK